MAAGPIGALLQPSFSYALASRRKEQGPEFGSIPDNTAMQGLVGCRAADNAPLPLF